MNLFENIISGNLGNKAFDYFRGTNPEDPTTSGLYQTIQGAANLYTGVAEEAKMGGQMEFEQKKEKARQFLSTKGYSPEVIESTLSQIEYKPSFLGRVREGLGTRMQEAAQTTERIAQQGITPKSLITAPVSYAGDVTATAFQPLVSAIEPYATPLVQKGIKATGQEQNVQKLSEEYAKLKQTSPNLADFLEGTLNVSQVLPSVFVKPVSQTVAQGGKAFVKTVENVAPKMVQETKNLAVKTPQAIGKGVTTGAEYTTSLATGLSREAQQTIKSAPKLYKEARLGNITAQGELENFVKATEARLTDLSELGTGYDAIKRGNKVATIDDITNAYVKATEGVRDTTLTKADKLVLKDANDYMSQMKGQLDETDILGLRRQLDSIMYDPNTGLKRKVSPNGERVVQTMRAEIDRIAKERIPGLAELDAKYGPEVSLLKDVKKQIYDANGNIKPTALSTISNIVGKNKDFKLEQFQKIYPELGARIKALKAFEEVQSLGEIKTGSVIRQGGAIAAGSAVAPGVGTVLAWMATNPYVVARVLELYGVAKSKISEMLNKGAKVSPKDAEIVVKAVQNTPKEKMADIINNLSFDPKTNRLTSGNIGPKKLNTMGKMEAAKVPKSIVAQENGIRRPYTLNGNKPIVKRASDVEGVYNPKDKSISIGENTFKAKPFQGFGYTSLESVIDSDIFKKMPELKSFRIESSNKFGVDFKNEILYFPGTDKKLFKKANYQEYLSPDGLKEFGKFLNSISKDDFMDVVKKESNVFASKMKTTFENSKKIAEKEATVIAKNPIKVYRGEGGSSIGNTTYVKGRYFADSKEFASTFGNVTESEIPAGTKIFDFSKINGNPEQKIIPPEILVDNDKLTAYIIDMGYDATMNKNSRGIEYVLLNKELNKVMKMKRNKEIIDPFKINFESVKDFWDNLDYLQKKSNYMIPDKTYQANKPKSIKGDEALMSEARKEQIKKGKIIGEGSDRKVIDLGNGTVIKIPKNERGIMQMDVDYENLSKKGLIPKVIEKKDGYVIFEKVENGGKIVDDMLTEIKSKNYKKDDILNILNKYGYKIESLDGITINELLNKNNWGLKNGKPIIIDEGVFNNERIFSKGKNLSEIEENIKYIKQKQREFKNLQKSGIIGESPKPISPQKTSVTQARGPIDPTTGKRKTIVQSPTAYEAGIRRPYTLNGNKPIVKRASDSKGPSISKGDEALMSEARKYKSAEEFIKAQGEILYHGGGNIKEVGNMRSKWQAFYMTDNPTYAKSYGGPNSVLNEIIILPKAKIVDMLNLSDDFLAKLDKILFDSNKLSRWSVDTIIKGIKAGKAHFAEDPNVKVILKKMGYDGMITRESKFGLNYGVWNKNVLKTKDQLKQIYEQATKPKSIKGDEALMSEARKSTIGDMETKKLIEEARKYKSAYEFIKKNTSTPIDGFKTNIENFFGKNNKIRFGNDSDPNWRKLEYYKKAVNYWKDRIQKGERPKISVSVDEDGIKPFRVYDGNHRLQAYKELYKELGITEIPLAQYSPIKLVKESVENLYK